MGCWTFSKSITGLTDASCFCVQGSKHRQQSQGGVQQGRGAGGEGHRSKTMVTFRVLLVSGAAHSAFLGKSLAHKPGFGRFSVPPGPSEGSTLSCNHGGCLQRCFGLAKSASRFSRSRLDLARLCTENCSAVMAPPAEKSLSKCIVQLGTQV